MLKRLSLIGLCVCGLILLTGYMPKSTYSPDAQVTSHAVYKRSLEHAYSRELERTHYLQITFYSKSNSSCDNVDFSLLMANLHHMRTCIMHLPHGDRYLYYPQVSKPYTKHGERYNAEKLIIKQKGKRS